MKKCVSEDAINGMFIYAREHGFEFVGYHFRKPKDPDDRYVVIRPDGIFECSSPDPGEKLLPEFLDAVDMKGKMQ
jgi:hypothetical protein